MNRTCEHLYSLLKPGGQLIIMDPHPTFLHNHDSEFLSYGDRNNGGYFSLRDKQFNGHIKKLDKKLINCRYVILSVTFESYVFICAHTIQIFAG